jgi:hypothetical protein
MFDILRKRGVTCMHREVRTKCDRCAMTLDHEPIHLTNACTLNPFQAMI